MYFSGGGNNFIFKMDSFLCWDWGDNIHKSGKHGETIKFGELS